MKNANLKLQKTTLENALYPTIADAEIGKWRRKLGYFFGSGLNLQRR
jgi:hypothetical protein